MTRTKWLLVCCLFSVCAFAAGTGLGLALPHVRRHQEGSKLFRDLAAETAPDKAGDPWNGNLAVRLRQKFNSSFRVIRSEPRQQAADAGAGPAFTVVILNRGSAIKVDGQALIAELEAYLKERTSAAGEHAEVRPEGDGGLELRYNRNLTGVIAVHIYADHWGRVAATMHVWEY